MSEYRPEIRWDWDLYWWWVTPGMLVVIFGVITLTTGVQAQELSWYWVMLVIIAGLILAIPATVIVIILLETVVAFAIIFLGLPILAIFLMINWISAGAYLWLAGAGVIYLGLGVFFGWKGVRTANAKPPSTFPDRNDLKRALGITFDNELDQKLDDIFFQSEERHPSQQERRGVEFTLLLELDKKLEASRPDPKKELAQQAAVWMLNCLYGLGFGAIMLITGIVLHFVFPSPTRQPPDQANHQARPARNWGAFSAAVVESRMRQGADVRVPAPAFSPSPTVCIERLSASCGPMVPSLLPKETDKTTFSLGCPTHAWSSSYRSNA